MRFSDTDGTSIVEFLEFFGMKKADRQMRYAHSVMKICHHAQPKTESIKEAEKDSNSVLVKDSTKELVPIPVNLPKEKSTLALTQPTLVTAVKSDPEPELKKVIKEKPVLKIVTDLKEMDSVVGKPEVIVAPASVKATTASELDAPINKPASPKRDPVDQGNSLIQSKGSSEKAFKPKVDLTAFLKLYELDQNKFENCFRKEAFEKRSVDGKESTDKTLYIGISGIEKAINSATPNIPMKTKVDLQVYMHSLIRHPLIGLKLILLLIFSRLSYRISLTTAW